MIGDDNPWTAPDADDSGRSVSGGTGKSGSSAAGEPTREHAAPQDAWASPHGGGYSGSSYTSNPGDAGGSYASSAVRASDNGGSSSGSRFARLLAVVAVSALIGGIVGAVTAEQGDDDTKTRSTTGVPANQASAQPATPSSIRSVLEKVQPAVVSIQVIGAGGQGTGTGMIISSDGEILTNAHVVSRAQRINVTLNGDKSPRPARLLGADANIDSAVIKLEDARDLPTVQFGDAKASQVGDQVVAIGNALALPGGPTVTTGIISAKDRTTPDQRGISQLENLIQTDAAINPGNSGGPLANLAGQVIGMNTEVIRGEQGEFENIGFALSTDSVVPALGDLRQGKTIARPYLGVSTVTLTSDIKNRFRLAPDKGALVASVAQDSPADASGLSAFDVITTFDGKPIDSAEGLVNLVRTKKVGDQASVEYFRGDEKRQVTVTLGSRPTDTGP